MASRVTSRQKQIQIPKELIRDGSGWGGKEVKVRRRRRKRDMAPA